MIKSMKIMVALALLISSAALAQTPTTTKPNVSNLLAACSANTPIVGNGAGVSPICHASGALGSAAFANTGTSGATIGLLNTANTWSAAQAFAAITATTLNGNTFTTGTGTLTLGAAKTATISNTLTFTGTDGSSVALGTGGTVLYSGGPLGTPSSGVGTNFTGIPNSALLNSSTTVAGSTCTLGSTCGMTSYTNSLAASVTMPVQNQYYDGPTVPQGTVGTWYASGSVTLLDTAGIAGFNCKLWDGTTVMASGRGISPAASYPEVIALSGILASPAGNIRISCADTASTTGSIQFNNSSAGKDSTVSTFRIQ